MEPEYYTKQLDFETWEVAKFESSDSPSAVYRIVRDVKERLRCSCPRWLRKGTTSCKHCAMVEDYINKRLQNERNERARAANDPSFK